MNIKQMEVFLHVAELQSFSKASEKLYLTQPTISAHVSALEKELGVKLIVRSSKGAIPTEDGQVLCEYAREMLALQDSAKAWFQNKRNPGKEILQVAASSIPAQYVLPTIMVAFGKENPKVSFQVSGGDSRQVVEHVLNRKAEVGMAGTIINNNRCIFEEFLDDRLVIITPNTERYRRMKQEGFDMRDLCKEPLILREPGSGTRKETESFFSELGISPREVRISAIMDDSRAIKQSVSEGLGISIMSRMAVTDYERFGQLQILDYDHPTLHRKLYLVYNRSHMLSESARGFIAFVKAYYADETNLRAEGLTWPEK